MAALPADGETLSDGLNTYGAQGWEVYQHQIAGDHFFVYMKRPLPMKQIVWHEHREDSNAAT